MEDDEIRVLRGVVYILKRIGPRTEPCGTPQVRGNEVDLDPEAVTVKDLEVRYEVNHFRGVPEIPNQVDRRWSKMEWSIVSKAAERSNRQRQETCCWLMALIRWSCRDKSVVSVEWCWVQAYWLGLYKEFKERWSCRRLLTIRSVILEMNDRLDIGR